MVSLADLAEQKRLRWAALAVLLGALLVSAGAALRAAIAVDAARGEVEARLSEFLGLPVRLDGVATARLLPWPRIRFEAVTLEPADGGPPLARADALDVSPDVAALLLGRLRPEQIRLVRPDMRLDPELRARLAGSHPVTRLAHWRPTTLVIEDGRLRVADPAGDETLEAIAARFAWPQATANLGVRIRLRWRDEDVRFALAIPSPDRLAEGAGGAIALRFDAPSLHVVASGSGGLALPPRFDGEGEIDVIDAVRFARWTGLPRIPDLLVGRFVLGGHVGVDAEGMTLSSARLDFDGHRADGALSWHWNQPRPRLAGTLAFATLDFTGSDGRLFGSGWRALPLDRVGFGHDLDLRLSAPAVRLPGVSLENVAAAVLVAEGRVNAEVGNADLFGRPIAAELRGTLEAKGLVAHLRATADDLPLANLARLVGVTAIENGRVDLSATADARCPTLGTCAAATEGRLQATARDVTVTGISPFADVSRFHPIVPSTNGTRITTLWTRADADLRFVGTRADVDRVEITGQSVRFLVRGGGDLETGALDLNGHAYFPPFRPDPARNGASEVALPIRIGGTLRQLEVTAREPSAADGSPPRPDAP